MKIVVCDNDEIWLDAFKTEFSDILSEHNVEYCTSPDHIFTITDSSLPDAVLLDIELDSDFNGLEYAERLQQFASNIRIILITAYTEKFIQELFFKQVNITAFLTKPIQREYLETALRKAQKITDEKKLHFQHKGVIVSLDEQNIVYLESSKHIVYIYTDSGDVYNYPGKLSELNSRLSADFIECHKSFIVNMRKIKKLEQQTIILESDKVIPISRSHTTETRNSFLRYLNMNTT